MFLSVGSPNFIMGQLAGLEPNADKLRTGTGTNLMPEKETYIYIYTVHYTGVVWKQISCSSFKNFVVN